MRNINDDIEMTLLSHEQIVDRCKELGKQLSEEYAGKDLILICILKGSVPFLSELIKHITIDVRMEFMCVSSYHGTTHSSGDVKIIKDIDCSLVGKDVAKSNRSDSLWYNKGKNSEKTRGGMENARYTTADRYGGRF